MQFENPILELGLNFILREYMTGGFVPLQSEERPGICARSEQRADQPLSQ